ncbi:hypothetical protein ABZ897_19895 [Nonomuraea sp. NPDC046802]|uniref:hypothetical protein n=1 Tax=Nonomuraea sp. NPDC046802 TaxID=3154919 RepID=UPI0034018B1A
MDVNLEAIKAVGEYDAYYFTDEGVIEASVYSLVRYAAPPTLLDLPGVEIQERLSPLFDIDLESEEPVFNRKDGRRARPQIRPGDIWNLNFAKSSRVSCEVSFGTASRRFEVVGDSLGGQGATIKIGDVSSHSHDETLRILGQVTGAVFFELDLRYGLALNIRKARSAGRARRRRAIPSSDVPRMPENQYSERPLSLYWYARSARGMPLLEFLAYYQVLEYHFPTYSHREALERIRHELRDPRFEREDDRHVERILTLASQFGGKGKGKEREQLKATIHACVTSEQLKEFLEEAPERLEHFTTKRIIEVSRIDPKSKQSDLRDQISERVYDLRCRIVHSKDDANEHYSEMLLPFSEEADRLGPDIDLVHLLAQKVLIASSSRLHV